eukprot:6167398-Amphidinium_carterae.1
MPSPGTVVQVLETGHGLFRSHDHPLLIVASRICNMLFLLRGKALDKCIQCKEENCRRGNTEAQSNKSQHCGVRNGLQDGTQPSSGLCGADEGSASDYWSSATEWWPYTPQDWSSVDRYDDSDTSWSEDTSNHEHYKEATTWQEEKELPMEL